ncbi:thioredoxin family protein [Zhouia sp. PK063]|uniref:thioredoxin family protein n=1 Tax=Zhouia sp. PK063 TaxID=3373602 RepID=UPI0037B35D2C
MAKTESNMLPLGTEAPNFNLPDTITGRNIKLSELVGEKGTVIMFICNHCPYVLHVIKEVTKLAKDYKDQGFGFVAISSNDVEKYPADAPDKMKAFAEQNDFIFHYLYDESQEVAKNYDAACTPDFYVFDDQLKLFYRGQLDDSRPGSALPVTGRDIRKSLDAILMGKNLYRQQMPSLGCGIKWKES